MSAAAADGPDNRYGPLILLCCCSTGMRDFSLIIIIY